MDKSISSWRKTLTYLLCGLINIQPVLANVVVGGTNTTTTTAGNGVEVVNIAAPNSKGLSHNQYQQFNVDKSGLILNNSTAQLSQSQLGGLLQNNPNLTGQAASVILNEVTGANRSQLQGYTEVFGASANVILSNPYGITCDGCGFINTPRVTLSTGTPEFTNGEVSGFDVSQGSVTVQGLGLDASQQTYFDIISRTAQINADIHAQNLTIVTGQNHVDYETNVATKKATSTSTLPALAIDSSSLGGMYAGRIALIATEKGVGVNVGNLAASQEGIHITADGKIVMGNSSSVTDLTVSTTNNIELSGNQSAGKQINLTGKNIVASNSRLVAGSEMALSARSVELIHSTAEAAQFTAQADRVSTDETSRVTSQSASLTQLGTLDNQGAVSVSNEMKVEGDSLSLTGAGNIKAATLTVDAQAISFETNAEVQDATLTARHAMALIAGAQLSASNDVLLSGESINQNGTLTANQTIALNASKTLTHNGTTQGKDVSITAQTLNQIGQLTGNQSVVINSDAVVLDGDTTAGQRLVVNADTLTIRGKVQSGDTVTLSGDTSLNTMAGSALLSGGDMKLDGSIVELAGTTQSAGSLIIDAQSSVLDGAVSAQQSVAISGKTVTQSGTLAAGDSLTLTQTESITLDGTVEAATDITATTQDFSSSLTLVSGGDITVTANDTTIDGVTSSGGDLTITSATLNQSGETLAQGDMTLITDNSNLTGSVESKQALAITANNRLTTASGTKLTSGDAITINAGTFTHQGHLTSQGNTQLTTQSLTNQGELTSNQNLSLVTDTLNHQGKLSANGDMALTVNGALVMSKNLSSGGDLSITAHSLNNRAEINSAKQTKVTLTGGLTNQSSGVISGDTTQITANSISNSGTLQAMTALTLATASLTNPGALIALGNLIATVSGTITNTGLIYAGNNTELYANVLNNYSDILTQNNLTIARNASNQKSNSLLNSSATIESLAGDISIYADTVTNKRTTLNIQNTSTDYSLASKPGAGGSSFEVNNGSSYAPEYTVSSKCQRHCGSSNDSSSEKYKITLTVTGKDTHSFKSKSETQSLSNASSSSRIVAANDVNIGAGTVLNVASQIHGEKVRITANKLDNRAYKLESYDTYYDYKLDEDDYVNSKGQLHSQRLYDYMFDFLFNRTDIRRVLTSSATGLNSSITATGNVSLNVANKVNNSTIKSNASRVSPSGSSKSAKNTHSANVTGPNAVRSVGVSSVTSPSITLPNFNNVPFPDFRLPSSPNGLFIYSKGPASGYLIETNPLLTNLGNYLGSDYFLGNVGFNPEKEITFLGDAFYDTRVVTQAIFEQTGKRYLNESVGNDFGQMQQLMDAAASQKSGLNLELGIALSPEQVANLSQDILWYEQIEVNGQTVLAPKLYLAQLTRDNISNGAVIAGRDIDIKAGKINNSGVMLADNTLSLKSDSTIRNDTGTLSGGGDVDMLAKGDIENISGTIEGEAVAITSTQGSFVNETLSEQLSVDDEGNWLEGHSDQSQITRTYVGDTATVKGGSSVSIATGNSIVSTGGVIESGGDVTLKAMNAIVLDTIQTDTHTDVKTDHKQTVSSDTNYVDSRVIGNGNVTLQSGGNLMASGGEISSGESLNIQVGGDLTLLANETNRYRADTSSHKKEIERQTRQEGTTLEAGKSLNITTGGDANLVASTVSAEESMTIQTGGELNAIAAQESDYELHFEKKSSFWGDSTTETEIETTRAKGAVFRSGEDIVLVSQDNQSHQASELEAQNNIHLESTNGTLAFEAAEESDSYRHETKKSGFMVKMKGKGNTSTTQKLTSMTSGGDITLAGALGIEVDYVTTNNQLGKALNDLPAGEQYAWMAQLKDNPNVNWNEVNEAFDSWSYSEQSLSGPAAAIIAIALAAVTAGAGLAVAGGEMLVTATVGTNAALASTVAAVGSAATSTLISQAGLSFINNGGDIGATFKDLGSSANTKALLASILTAGALAGYDSALAGSSSVNETALASGNPSIYTPVPNISVDSVLTQVGRSGIEAGISTTIYDTNFGDAFLNSLQGAIANDIGAFAANEIGDLRLKNGSLEKTALHAVTQGTVAELAGGDFAAGAAAGAAAELTGELVGGSGLDKNHQVGISGLIGATAGLLATGDTEGVYTGQTAGMGVYQFNHLNHDTKVLLEALKESCGPANRAACEVAMQLELLDKQTDQDLLESCTSGDANCVQKIVAAQKDLDSYNNLLPDDDYELFKERNSIENVLIGIDPNYPKWDTEGMKEFGYSMVSEPEGVMICMGMTFGGCAPLATISTVIGGIEVIDDISTNGLNSNHYNTAAYITGVVVDKTILGKLIDNSTSELMAFELQGINQLINSTLNKLAEGAKDYESDK